MLTILVAIPIIDKCLILLRLTLTAVQRRGNIDVRHSIRHVRRFQDDFIKHLPVLVANCFSLRHISETFVDNWLIDERIFHLLCQQKKFKMPRN